MHYFLLSFVEAIKKLYSYKGKVVPVLFLNRAPRYEGVLRSGGIAKRIIDLGTRWR